MKFSKTSKEKPGYLGDILRGEIYHFQRLILQSQIAGGKKGIDWRKLSWLQNIQQWTRKRDFQALHNAAIIRIIWWERRWMPTQESTWHLKKKKKNCKIISSHISYHLIRENFLFWLHLFADMTAVYRYPNTPYISWILTIEIQKFKFLFFSNSKLNLCYFELTSYRNDQSVFQLECLS